MTGRLAFNIWTAPRKTSNSAPSTSIFKTSGGGICPANQSSETVRTVCDSRVPPVWLLPKPLRGIGSAAGLCDVELRQREGLGDGAGDDVNGSSLGIQLCRAAQQANHDCVGFKCIDSPARACQSRCGERKESHVRPDIPNYTARPDRLRRISQQAISGSESTVWEPIAKAHFRSYVHPAAAVNSRQTVAKRTAPTQTLRNRFELGLYHRIPFHSYHTLSGAGSVG